jgi:hypothetical protein
LYGGNWLDERNRQATVPLFIGLEGDFYGDGAVFQSGDRAIPVGVIRGFEGQGMWAFGEGQRRGRGAHKLVVEKDFCTVGVA